MALELLEMWIDAFVMLDMETDDDNLLWDLEAIGAPSTHQSSSSPAPSSSTLQPHSLPQKKPVVQKSHVLQHFTPLAPAVSKHFGSPTHHFPPNQHQLQSKSTDVEDLIWMYDRLDSDLTKKA